MSKVSSVQRLTQADREILVYVEEALKYLVDSGAVSLNRSLELIKKPTKYNLIRVLSLIVMYGYLVKDRNLEKAAERIEFMLSKISIMTDFEY